MATRIRLATFNVEELDDPDFGAAVPVVPGGGVAVAGAGAVAGVAVADPPAVARRSKPTLAERIRVMRPQLERLDADILCLQEVHGQKESGSGLPRTLSALDDLIAGTPLEGFNRQHTTTAAGEPEPKRNLVVLSRFGFMGNAVEIKHKFIEKPMYRKVTANPVGDADPIDWERPILKVQINLGKHQGRQRVLHLLNVHMKSKIPSEIPGAFKPGRFNVFFTASGWAEGIFVSAIKRVGQALEARVVIDDIFNKAEQAGEEALIAICGDFNAANDETPLKAIRSPIEEIGNVDLVPRIMIPCELNIPESSRYSLFHLGKGELLDHVLVSRGMFRYFRGAEIHNETLPDESGAFRTDAQFPESDHAPIVAEFEIPDAE